MKIITEVGDKEKHIVAFSWNPLTGKTKINVDGKEILRTRWLIQSPTKPAEMGETSTQDTWVIRGKAIQLRQEWKITTGNKEKHNVSIQKIRPRWFAGLRPHLYEVLIDGRLVERRKGY